MPLSDTHKVDNSQAENINIQLSGVEDSYRFAVSVDCVIFGYSEAQSLQVLLLTCNMAPYDGLWGLLGDLLHPDENLEEAPSRILRERAGLLDVYYEQVQTFGRVNRHPIGRVVSTAFYSLVQISSIPLPSSSFNRVRWFNIDELDHLAFDHQEIIETCLARLRRRLRESPLGFNLLPQKFSLPQLQTLYEVALDITLDKRNFRRKIKSLEILEELDEYQSDVGHRPGRLYQFRPDRYEKLRRRGLKFEL